MRRILYVFKKVITSANPRKLVQNLWANRYLIYQMVIRDLGQKYSGTFLGVIWNMINPLLTLVIYTFVFSVIFKAKWRANSSGTEAEFAITMLAGLIAFNVYSEITNRSTTIVTQFPNYVKKVVFPLETLVFVVAASAVINSLFGVLILLIGSLVIYQTIPFTIVFLPLAYIPIIFLSLGIGWFLASLGVYIRDVNQVIPIINQALFFLTPVIYSASSIPKNFQFVVQVNPLAPLVEYFRMTLIWGELLPLGQWAVISGFTFLLALLGYAWFVLTKKGFADVL